MEAILNCIFSIQLALGPYIAGSEVVRTLSVPPRVVNSSTSEIRTLTDQATGQVIEVVYIEGPASESLATGIYESFGQVLFFPTISLVSSAPALDPVVEQIFEDYVELVDFTSEYLIIEEQPLPR
jgi:hypothetical protein